jgi:hypothetical protein
VNADDLELRAVHKSVLDDWESEHGVTFQAWGDNRYIRQ